MDAHPFSEQLLPPWRRAVLKVGSSLLMVQQFFAASFNTEFCNEGYRVENAQTLVLNNKINQKFCGMIKRKEH